MGPFPYDAPKPKISKLNPAGTDGFEFVEFAHSNLAELSSIFVKMGYRKTAKHKSKNIEFWQQGDITYFLNGEEDSFGREFVKILSPYAPSIGWHVVDTDHAFHHAISKGATPYQGHGKSLGVFAIYGIGGPLIYFIDQYGEANPYDEEYDWLADPKPEGFGYLDHLTHNGFRGNMDKWVTFYTELFNFR